MPFQLKKNTNASLPILMKRRISNNIIYFSEAVNKYSLKNICVYF